MIDNIMKNNLQILEEEYYNFYSEFYEIKGSHSNALKTVQRIAEHVENKNNKILEYGCATGYNLRYLHNEGYTNLCGIDGVSKFIDIARSKQKNINFKCCNLAKEGQPISLEGQKYDIIFCRGVLQQGKTRREKIKNSDDDIKRIIENFYRLLSKEGKIVISEGPVRNWEQLFSELGFGLVLKEVPFSLYVFKKHNYSLSSKKEEREVLKTKIRGVINDR